MGRIPSRRRGVDRAVDLLAIVVGAAGMNGDVGLDDRAHRGVLLVRLLVGAPILLLAGGLVPDLGYVCVVDDKHLVETRSGRSRLLAYHRVSFRAAAVETIEIATRTAAGRGTDADRLPTTDTLRKTNGGVVVVVVDTAVDKEVRVVKRNSICNEFSVP